MIEKPKSFQAYAEDRESGDRKFSSGLYNELYRKLQETRKAIEESGALNDPEVLRKVESIYRSRGYNLNLDSERKQEEIEAERIRDLIAVAKKIKEMQKDAGLPEDEGLSIIIDDYKQSLAFHDNRASGIAEAIEKNQETSDGYTEDTRVMGKIETDAYEEKDAREREL